MLISYVLLWVYNFLFWRESPVILTIARYESDIASMVINIWYKQIKKFLKTLLVHLLVQSAEENLCPIQIASGFLLSWVQDSNTYEVGFIHVILKQQVLNFAFKEAWPHCEVMYFFRPDGNTFILCPSLRGVSILLHYFPASDLKFTEVWTRYYIMSQSRTWCT